MGFLDWLTTPAPKTQLVYVDEARIPRRLTPEQFGGICVEWAVGNANGVVTELRVLGRVKDEADILAKIRDIGDFRFIAFAHTTAFFTAIYCSYPVLRLHATEQLLHGVLKGVNTRILAGSDLFKEFPASLEYLQEVNKKIVTYIGIIFDVCREDCQPGDDRMLVAVGAGSKLASHLLSQDYAGVPSKPREKLASAPTTDESPNFFKGNFINPHVEATRTIDSETLLLQAFANRASEIVRAFDANGITLV